MVNLTIYVLLYQSIILHCKYFVIEFRLQENRHIRVFPKKNFCWIHSIQLIRDVGIFSKDVWMSV